VLVESIAIFMVLLVMVFLFLRAHKRDYAISAIPLTIVPLMHTLTQLLGEIKSLHLSPDIRAAADVLGLAIAVAMMGMFCTRCRTRRSKYAYLLLCGGFVTALTIIFIYNTYVPA
jgi:hypothetical protein